MSHSCLKMLRLPTSIKNFPYNAVINFSTYLISLHFCFFTAPDILNDHRITLHFQQSEVWNRNSSIFVKFICFIQCTLGIITWLFSSICCLFIQCDGSVQFFKQLFYTITCLLLFIYCLLCGTQSFCGLVQSFACLFGDKVSVFFVFVRQSTCLERSMQIHMDTVNSTS